MVPQIRLLFWFAVIVLPFSALGAVYAEAFLFSVALTAGLFAFALLDAVLAFGKLDGLSLELPEVLRVSKERLMRRGAVGALRANAAGSAAASIDAGLVLARSTDWLRALPASPSA